MEQDKKLIANQTFNQEQLDELLNSGTKYDFISCKFNIVNFTEKSNIDFISDCEFRSCRFENFHAESIEANNSTFHYCFFESCNLSNGHFISSKFNGCSFDDSKLNQGNFTFAKIKDTVFSNETNFSAVKFHGAEMDTVYFDNCIVNEAVEGLYKENITLSGATSEEIETHRKHIFSELKLEPISFEQIEKQVKKSLEPLPEIEKNSLSDDNIHQKQQFEIINKYNPAPNEYQTWIRKAEDIKTFENTLKDTDWDGWEQNGFDESYSAQNVKDALETGKITVYSSHPIKQGVFVTPSPMEARSYSSDGKIYSKKVALNDVAWIDPTQGQYANVEEYKLLSPAELEVKFNGDYWSLVDKETQKNIELPTGYKLSEIFYIMAQEHPEYRAFIYNNMDELIEDVAKAEQAISDEAVSVKHDRLSAAISQGGFGEDMADSAAYHQMQHLESQINSNTQTAFDISNVFDSLIKEYNLGKITIQEIAEELYKSGDFNYIPSEKEVIEKLNQYAKDFNATPPMIKQNNILENETEHEISRLTLEEYLAQKGLSSPIDDFMLDKLKLPHGQSKYDERTMHENARKSSQDYHEKRNAAIQEYNDKVATGEIVEPTNLERYIKRASGNPEKVSVQAARRVLEKRGYTQNGSGEWILSHSPNEQNISNSINKKYLNSEKPLTKEEFDKLTSEIKDIAKTYQSDPELLTDYLAFKMQFYNYSPTNTMLIHLQNPHATFVASFTKWKQLGYSIKKGQHHIKISRPIETSKFQKEIKGKTVWTDVKYASAEEKSKIASGELEIKKFTKFIPHQVFDISQTNCPIEDYPKFYNMGYPDIEQQQLYECIKQFAKESGFTVTEEDLSSISLHGYYNKTDNSIHINSLLEDSKRLETMCHELAHGVLHRTSTQPTEIAEFEAECFGSMLKRKMGFPISEESKRYINQYFKKSDVLQKGKFDMDKTLNRLSKAFNHVTKGIDETISNMGFAPEKEIALNLSQAKSNAINPLKISENFMQALS